MGKTLVREDLFKGGGDLHMNLPGRFVHGLLWAMGLLILDVLNAQLFSMVFLFDRQTDDG